MEYFEHWIPLATSDYVNDVQGAVRSLRPEGLTQDFVGKGLAKLTGQHHGERTEPNVYGTLGKIEYRDGVYWTLARIPDDGTPKQTQYIADIRSGLRGRTFSVDTPPMNGRVVGKDEKGRVKVDLTEWEVMGVVDTPYPADTGAYRTVHHGETEYLFKSSEGSEKTMTTLTEAAMRTRAEEEAQRMEEEHKEEESERMGEGEEHKDEAKEKAGERTRLPDSGMAALQRQVNEMNEWRRLQDQQAAQEAAQREQAANESAMVATARLRGLQNPEAVVKAAVERGMSRVQFAENLAANTFDKAFLDSVQILPNPQPSAKRNGGFRDFDLDRFVLAAAERAGGNVGGPEEINRPGLNMQRAGLEIEMLETVSQMVQPYRPAFRSMMERNQPSLSIPFVVAKLALEADRMRNYAGYRPQDEAVQRAIVLTNATEAIQTLVDAGASQQFLVDMVPWMGQIRMPTGVQDEYQVYWGDDTSEPAPVTPADAASITETTFGITGDTISPRTVATYHKVGEQLNRFQSQGLSQYFLIAAQNFVRRHWANAIIDSGVTGGSGSEVFQGVWDDLAGSSASHTFLQRYRFAGATPARTDIYAIRAKLKAAAAEGDNYGWIMDTGLETDFLGTPEVANFPSWLAEEAVSMGGTGRGMVQKWQPYWQTHVLEDRAVAAPNPVFTKRAVVGFLDAIIAPVWGQAFEILMFLPPSEVAAQYSVRVYSNCIVRNRKNLVAAYR